MCERIIAVGRGYVKVRSRWVKLSDKLKIMGVIPKENDLAVIRDFGDESVVVDIIPHSKPMEDDDEEYQEQLRKFKALSGDY